jgi:hypothetical protein
MPAALDVTVLAAASPSLGTTSQRLLPLGAGVLLLLVVFHQLQRVEPADEGRYSWGRRLIAGTVGLGFPVLLMGLGAVIFSVQGPMLLRPSQIAVGAGSAARPAPSSRPSGSPGPTAPGLLSPDPQKVTLMVADLPAGYHVLKALPVVFSSGESPSPSWDVVFEPDSANTAADYSLAESLAIVYPSLNAANGAIDDLGTVERANHFQQYVPVSRVGDRNVVWVEKTSNRPDLVVVRVTFRISNLVGQVSILTSSANPRPERALQLATIQAARMKGNSPVVHSLPTQGGSAV